ncbi:MAG: RNA-binding domain-containing protein [Promethearchaeota archaeon]
MNKVEKQKKNQTRINSFIAECYVHETEVMEKVERALTYLLPQDYQTNLNKNFSLFREKMEGHFQNSIWRLKLELKKEYAQETTFYLFDRLIRGEKDKILTEFEQRFDTKALALYLRLNKQKLAQNEIWLADGLDPVKIRIKIAGISGPKRVIESENFLKEYLEK